MTLQIADVPSKDRSSIQIGPSLQRLPFHVADQHLKLDLPIAPSRKYHIGNAPDASAVALLWSLQWRVFPAQVGQEQCDFESIDR